MAAGAIEVGLAQPPHEGGGVLPHGPQLVEQRDGGLRAIAAGARNLRRVPALERRSVGGQEDADAAREAAAIGLDEMTEHLLHAPHAGRRMPGQHALRHRRQLRA